MLSAHSHLRPVAQLRLPLCQATCSRFVGCLSLSFIVMDENDALQTCHTITSLYMPDEKLKRKNRTLSITVPFILSRLDQHKDTHL